MESFVAVDVETANSFFGSICQIGAVRFRNGFEVEAASWLVDPEDEFDEVNVRVHGITPLMVRGKPSFASMLPEFLKFAGSDLLVCHTHFDRTSFGQACNRTGSAMPACQWLDTACVARRTWKVESFGLKPLAAHLGIEFRHHDALEDARAAGTILLRAIEASGIPLADWPARAGRRIDGKGKNIRLDGLDDGPLGGERMVFTGRIAMPRVDAARLANELGAAIDTNVTKQTTILVVGDQDLSKLNGHLKSNKHRKAESLIAKGQPIRIVAESDFLALS